MHRAATKQMKVTLAPADLLHDDFEPVHTILYQRGSKVNVLIDCRQNITVMTDQLRLKQFILNLGRNSSKCCFEGFIRSKAQVVDGNVELSVEDSGTGTPQEKRENLFLKFQESLDTLNRGTGLVYTCAKCWSHLWVVRFGSTKHSRVASQDAPGLALSFS